jgi:hypothetical protein
MTKQDASIGPASDLVGFMAKQDALICPSNDLVKPVAIVRKAHRTIDDVRFKSSSFLSLVDIRT